MKVKDLIEKLKTLPQEAEVYVRNDEHLKSHKIDKKLSDVTFGNAVLSQVDTDTEQTTNYMHAALLE